MQSTQQPVKFVVPFAQNDPSKVEIPVTTSDDTRASQTLGFPPRTGLPPEAGGVPPQLPDFNGATNQIARIAHWYELGGMFPFDGTFANASEIGGYPRGALLRSVDFTGAWLSTAESNLANPDTTPGSWVPGYHYGATTLAAQAGGTVVLTPAQAAKRTLFVSGTLTSNLVIEVPAWIYDWTVYNTTSGAFSVSMRTPGRPATVIPQSNVPASVRGNGTDVLVVAVDVPLASTTVAGRARYATAGESTAGSIQDAAVTPFGLTQAVNNVLTTVVRQPSANNIQLSWAGTQLNLAVDNSPQGSFVLGSNNIRLAWVGSQLNLTVDNTAQGTIALRGWVADGYAPKVSPVFSGPVTFSSGVLIGGGQTFLATSTTNGNVFLRPNGIDSTAGQAVLLPSGNFSVSGSMTANGGFDTPSSREIKNDLGAFPYGLADVLALTPIRYAYKDDPDQRARLGFYLEDTRPIAPEVAGAAAIQEHQIIPMLVAAIHELSAELEALKAAR